MGVWTMKRWVLPMLPNSGVSQDTASYALASHGCDIQSSTVFHLALFSSLLPWMWVFWAVYMGHTGSGEWWPHPWCLSSLGLIAWDKPWPSEGAGGHQVLGHQLCPPNAGCHLVVPMPSRGPIIFHLEVRSDIRPHSRASKIHSI